MIQVQTGNMLDVVVEGKSIGLKQRDGDHRKYEIIWLPDPESLAMVLLTELKRLNPATTGAGAGGRRADAKIEHDWQWYDRNLRATGYTDLANRMLAEFKPGRFAVIPPAAAAEEKEQDSDLIDATITRTAPPPAPWQVRLYDRADGVREHYCVGRWNPVGYHEFWNKDQFCSVGEVFIGRSVALAKARELSVSAPTAVTAVDATQNEPSLEDLAIQAATYLEEFNLVESRHLAFALRARVNKTPSTIAPGEGAREVDDARRCGFCFKSEREVETLVKASVYICNECEALPPTEPTQAGVDTNDAELWRYFTSIAIQRGFESIPDAVTKAGRAAPADAGEVERTRRGSEYCESSLKITEQSMIEAQTERDRLRAELTTVLQSCIDIVNNASVLPFDSAPYVSRAEVLERLEALNSDNRAQVIGGHDEQY